MTQQCADALGSAIVAHTADWHMLQRVFVDDLDPRPPQRREPTVRRDVAMRIGIVCPYSFDVPGGVQFHVRDLAEHFLGAGPPRLRAGAGRRGHPAARRTSSPSAARCRCATTARWPGSTSGRSPRRGSAGGWSAGDFDVVHLHEPVTPEHRAARPVVRRGARRRDLPHLQPALAGHAGGLPAAAPQPREDPRPDRRLRGRPPHRHDPPGRRRRRHPQRRQRRPLRRRPSRTRAGPGTASRPDDRLPRPDRRAAQGAAGARGRPARGPRASTRAPGCWSRGRATSTPPASGSAPRSPPRPSSSAWSATRTRRPCCPRSTSTSRRTRGARASASCWSRR